LMMMMMMMLMMMMMMMMDGVRVDRCAWGQTASPRRSAYYKLAR
jgi:hypothetical protein